MDTDGSIAGAEAYGLTSQMSTGPAQLRFGRITLTFTV